jgi:hypothetical protein
MRLLCRHSTAHHQRLAGAVHLHLKGSSDQDHRRNRESVAPRQILFADGGATLQADVLDVKPISSWTEEFVRRAERFLFSDQSSGITSCARSLVGVYKLHGTVVLLLPSSLSRRHLFLRLAHRARCAAAIRRRTESDILWPRGFNAARAASIRESSEARLFPMFPGHRDCVNCRHSRAPCRCSNLRPA